MASILEVGQIRAAGGNVAMEINAAGTVNYPQGMTVAGVDPFAANAIERGTRAQRSTATAETIRYNTDDAQLEHYFENPAGAPSDSLWVPVGGRKLVAWVERSDPFSSLDIFWGPGTGSPIKQYYNSYEVIMNFYEQGGGNGEYYCRFIKADGSVDSGQNYYHMGSGWHANDGRPRDASGTGGRTYFQITTLNGSYELQSNGEASWGTTLWFSNTPNNSTANYWAFYYHGGGATEQNGGAYYGGGVWRGASQYQSTAYPMGGLRIYNNQGMRSVTSGCNFACAVYATQPAIRDYPLAGPYTGY